MGYRVDPETGEVFCETAEDAVEIAALIRGQRPVRAKEMRSRSVASKPKSIGSKNGNGHREPKISDIVRGLSENTKEILRAIADAPEYRLSTVELLKHLGWENGSGIGGAIGSITKQASRQHYNAERFITRLKAGDGADAQIYYAIPQEAVVEVKAGLA